MDKQKILIADDEQTVRLMVSRILGEDYTVLEAADGEEAVEIATQHQPALVLMDLMMPRLDGYAACQKIKSDQATRQIPVVMLTAIDHELNKKFAEEMGADGYITKPFNRQSLLEETRRLTLPTAPPFAQMSSDQQ
ncbi:MAG: response regulator [Dehalococcoidia bacterium]|nr:response regulator [Dehalococcoidia bacterium]